MARNMERSHNAPCAQDKRSLRAHLVGQPILSHAAFCSAHPSKPQKATRGTDQHLARRRKCTRWRPIEDYGMREASPERTDRIMELSFEKYEGIGNDFIVCRLDTPQALSVEAAQKLCDRHYGVGADGVLILSPAKSRRAQTRLSVVNADGSQPEMCGNGLRCVALSLADPSSQLSELVIETDAGPKQCQVERNGHRAQVTTHLGRGELLGTIDLEHDGMTLNFIRVSMGNPHAVAFTPQLPEKQLDQLGPLLSGRLVGGSNVEIATILANDSIELTVWERGVGRTLACGTGAAATAVAAISAGHANPGTPVTVHLPGGPLTLTVSEQLDVLLRGPARFVYRGTADLEHFDVERLAP